MEGTNVVLIVNLDFISKNNFFQNNNIRKKFWLMQHNPPDNVPLLMGYSATPKLIRHPGVVGRAIEVME